MVCILASQKQTRRFYLGIIQLKGESAKLRAVIVGFMPVRNHRVQEEKNIKHILLYPELFLIDCSVNRTSNNAETSFLQVKR